MSSKPPSTGIRRSHRADYLQCFYRVVSNVWGAYQKSGPGSLPVEWQRELEESYDPLKNGLTQKQLNCPNVESEELIQVCRELYTLSMRCLMRPEGLCFVSGEAGLVPRRDLHEQFERSIETLRSVCKDD